MFKVGDIVILDGEITTTVSKVDKKGNVWIEGLKSVKFDENGNQIVKPGGRVLNHVITKKPKRKKNADLERCKTVLASQVVDIMIADEGVQHTDTYMHSALKFHIGAIDVLETEEDVDRYISTYVPKAHIKEDILSFVDKNNADKALQREEVETDG